MIESGNLPGGTWTHQWRIHQDDADVAGDDLLDGGSENDILHGGGGNDTYRFGYGYYGSDIISDTGGAEDLIGFDNTPRDNLIVSRQEDDLLVQ